MNNDLHQLLAFTSFTHEIRKVKRSMWVKDEELLENDSEHSFQLAMIAMFIIQENSLSFDINKCMSMAIVHDVLEVHAGDTHIFGSNSDIKSKTKREKEAIEKLKNDWPNLNIMHQLISEYEIKETDEAKFIYALDKLTPMLNNYLDNGRNWKRENITLSQIIKAKTGKIDKDSTVNNYYEGILKQLKSKPEFFSENQLPRTRL